MIVLMDLEWVENGMGHCSPTQVAARRVDSAWNTVDDFYARMRPRDKAFHQWNDAWNAVRFLDDLYDTSSITSEQRQEIEAFQDKLEVEVVPFNEKKAEEERQERMRRSREGIPYVGVSESYISMTSLGAPSSDVRHNYECISGEQYLANLYDYKENGHTIFTARCVQSKVIQVWDNRGQDTSRPAYRPSTSSKSDDDPYDVNDYHHAEDFYYDHYDDFFDYYDAEDYFNKHKD